MGVQFGSYDSVDDFGLILQTVRNPNPEAKTYYVSVPGADEAIDLTDVFGDVHYEQRTLTFTFAYTGGTWYRYTSNGTIANALHGKKVKIILPDDISHYYYGRVSLDEWVVDKSLGTLTFTCVCDPWRYDVQSSVEQWLWDSFSFVDGRAESLGELTVDGTTTIHVSGSSRNLIPTYICTAPFTVTYRGTTVSLAAGSTKCYETPIVPGTNDMTIKGTGRISVDYRGISL